MGSKNAKAMPSPKPKPKAAAAPKPPNPPAKAVEPPMIHGYSRKHGGEVTLPADVALSGRYPSPLSPACYGYGNEYGEYIRQPHEWRPVSAGSYAETFNSSRI
eukprot:TRINITY_DN4458_c0_g1_i1.p2 TRINITY_DN4458_c0_g1~~TRINITY_DN4458_c0_g1_i1.p2  ORF type:complete len:112 (-),score=9.44 TRINITY_DN4458_c0_g1_i1:165-473(-)